MLFSACAWLTPVFVWTCQRNDTAHVGPPPALCYFQEQLDNFIAHKAVVPLFLTFVKITVVVELGCITWENGICSGQGSSGAKARGRSLWFADGGFGNDILVTSSYPQPCFLLALKLSV